ncbi:MAG: adenylate kinase [Coleofasciculaceae cyanobacterium]
MRLVILGGPGAGKGTQGQLLCRQLAIPLVSTGDILRLAIANQTELGRKAKTYVEKGELVPDSIMIEFMRERLLQPDAAKGWLLEGYPRTAFQAEELDFLLDDLGQRLNWAIYLKVSESVMLKRCLKRAQAGSDETQSNSPQNQDKSKSTSTNSPRSDDQPEIVERRIKLFQERTVPILEYYGYRQRLLTIDAEQAPEQVKLSVLGQISV